MRVAVMVWGGLGWLGGWNYYLNMARVLAAHAPDIRLRLFLPSGVPDWARAEAAAATGEPIEPLPARSRLKDAAALAGMWDRDFARRFRQAGIDVVLEQARFLGRGFPIATLPWICDLQHRTYPHYFSRSQRLMRDIGYRAQVRGRKHAFVSSESAKRDLLDLVPRPRATVHVAPFAVRPTVAVNAEGVKRVAQRHGLEGRYVFMPNQLWRHKNHAVALRAMGLLASRGAGLTLALSGRRDDPRDPAYSAELAALSDELGVGSSVQWLGTVPFEDLLHLTAGAEALLNPSLFEGWSTTVEEAKALGAPMVLSRIDVHLEQARDHAVFFDPQDPTALADALQALEPQRREDLDERLGAAAAANLVDQANYAATLRAMFEAAVRDGPG